MKVQFWGTRGSLPASFTAADARRRALRILELAAGAKLDTAADREAFVDRDLPFALSGFPGTNTCCVEVIAGGPEHVFVDAGSGLRDFSARLMKTPKGRQPGTYHIFVTHLHWDHVMGLPFFAPIYLAGNRIVFHGHHPELPAVVRAQFGHPTFPVPFDSLAADIRFDVRPPGTPFLDLPGLKVTSMAQNHPGISYGYRFEAGGQVFVFSSDSEHKQDAYAADYRFLGFFEGADLLVFDAQYSLAEATFSKADWGHSSNIMGVELAARARVKHLSLFHHEPTSTPEELDEYLRNTRLYLDIYHGDRMGSDEPLYPERVSLAYDGMEVDLTPPPPARRRR